MRGGGLAAACALLLGTALLACTATVTTTSPGSEPAESPGTAATADTGGGVAALPAACHLQLAGALPDMACAPGATDPAVTQANVGSTICVSGYTTRVRPPVSYTDPIKTDMIRRYGLRGAASAYELDHLVPLEVGGAPRSVRNLWPEPRNQHPGASEKDHLENLLHDRVCQGRMPLADAQRMFEQNWVDAWHQLGSP
ncbi:MAG TPA: hypothetical protein VOB72_18325 [Candidatus Dormibacteraeota bacterium]|nr:hypothetical protein [Candidatus Dormibacteraeota bacterium]